MSEDQEHGKKSHGHGGGGHGGGHGGGGHEEHEGAPEWLISFADNTALMMGFFVILLAMSMNKPTGAGAGETPVQAPMTDRMLDTAIAIREAFHSPVDLSSTDPMDLPLIRRIHERRGESQADDAGQKGREHDVRSIRPSDYYSTAGRVPFGDSSSSIETAGSEAISQLLPLLKGHNLIIEVRGHVSAAEAFGRSDRGVGLSYERALAVAKAITAEGVSWQQLRLVAAGDSERLVPVAYEAGEHRSNQRVELIVTDQVVPER